MSDKFLDTLAFEEFDSLVQDYLDRPDPDAISFEVFQQLADESNWPPVEIELTGTIRDGMLRLWMAQPISVPFQVRDDEFVIDGLRLVIRMLPELSATSPLPERVAMSGS